MAKNRISKVEESTYLEHHHRNNKTMVEILSRSNRQIQTFSDQTMIQDFLVEAVNSLSKLTIQVEVTPEVPAVTLEASMVAQVVTQAEISGMVEFRTYLVNLSNSKIIIIIIFMVNRDNKIIDLVKTIMMILLDLCFKLI